MTMRTPTVWEIFKTYPKLTLLLLYVNWFNPNRSTAPGCIFVWSVVQSSLRKVHQIIYSILQSLVRPLTHITMLNMCIRWWSTMAVHSVKDVNGSKKKAWGRPWCSQDRSGRYAQALMKRFLPVWECQRLAETYETSYQATRDGVEAKEAHKENTGSSWFIRCYIKCLCVPISTPPTLPVSLC